VSAPLTAGLVLAAGEGRRFGGPKAPFVLDGERLVDRAVRVLADAGCDPVLVVLGAWVGDVPGATVVENPDWSEGMGSSLRAGLAALAELPEVDRAVVTLVDLPGLTVEAVRRVAGSPERLVQAAYDGVAGHPVLLGCEHWAGVSASAEGDRGARAYLAEHPPVLVEVGDVARPEDLDVRPGV
jgi:CTP:molybdopterin cytidylyltransferase MocA